MIASLRTFSQEKLQFWRESASGINRVAYFLAKDTVDLFNVLVKPVIYLSMFYYFSNPRSSFLENFEITVVFVYCVTGIAYIFAILLQPAPAQLVMFRGTWNTPHTPPPTFFFQLTHMFTQIRPYTNFLQF